MPVAAAPLPKTSSGDHLGEVIAVVLTLKMAGASSGLVKMALGDTSLPEEVKKTAQTISEGILAGYKRETIYQQQPSYP